VLMGALFYLCALVVVSLRPKVAALSASVPAEVRL
jgi:hypothetical protein